MNHTIHPAPAPADRTPTPEELGTIARELQAEGLWNCPVITTTAEAQP